MEIPIISLSVMLTIYFSFSLLISIFMYRKIKKFFPSNKKIKFVNEINQTKENLTEKQVNNDASIEVNDLNSNQFDEAYPEFVRKDMNQFSFIRILFGTCFLVIIRFFIFVGFLIILVTVFTMINCFMSSKREIPQTSKAGRIFLKILIYLTIFPIQICIGFISIYSRKDDEKVKETYRKYFGNDYDFSKTKFSIYISNHYGWVESLFYVIRITPGFIAKAELGQIQIVSAIIRNIDCLLVKRADRDDKVKMVKQMKIRQEMFYNGETETPLLIYPEGTVSNGEYLLEFKKGAFMNLMPIKPLYCCLKGNNVAYLSPLPFFEHMYYYFCFLWNTNYFYELPIMECTEFMLKNHSKENESPDDTYARVASLVYQEVFDLKYSTKTYKDLDDYEIQCANRQ